MRTVEVRFSTWRVGWSFGAHLDSTGITVHVGPYNVWIHWHGWRPKPL